MKAVDPGPFDGADSLVDLDGLMVRNLGDTLYWDEPDTIIFSIRAAANWDGGEIVVLPFVGAPTFLNHGGHVWNTAFVVGATFGIGDIEEVDAIEAWKRHPLLPALTNYGLLVLLVLLVISGIIVIRHRRRGVMRA